MLAVVLLLWHFLGAAEGLHYVIIDAGSTGSRVHVYSLGFERITFPHVKQLGKGLKNHAALAAFAAHPHLAGSSLHSLIDYAHEQVPKNEIREAGIHLLATAGLRMLRAALVQPILESCRQVLAASGFKFESSWAAVLPGSTEGIYGFVAANYASGALQRATEAREQSLQSAEPEGFTGVLELGGASLQVTFQVDADNSEGFETRQLSLAGLQLEVFTHSFLGFGQDSAQNLALKLASSQLKPLPPKTKETELDAAAPNAVLRVLDPCLPRNYEGELDGTLVSGGGYFSLCRQITAGLVLGNCSALHCSLAGLSLPPLTGRFLAIENLQYTAGFLGLPHGATIRQFLEAAQSSCTTAWPEMLQQYRDFEAEHLLRYCFGIPLASGLNADEVKWDSVKDAAVSYHFWAAYAVALLHDGLGIGLDDSSLMFTDKITSPSGESILLDWTLGAVVLAAESKGSMQALDRFFPATNSSSRIQASSRATEQHRAGASTAEVALVILGIAIGAGFCLANGRNSRRHHWKRKRRRAKASGRFAESTEAEGNPEEESTDSESPFNYGIAGPHAVGRRQNVLRSGDLEQGCVS